MAGGGLACVAGVERGRGRGNLGAHKSVMPATQARGGLPLCTVNGKEMDAFVLPFSCLKHTLYCDCKENKNHNIIKRHTARLFLGLLTLDHHDND